MAVLACPRAWFSAILALPLVAAGYAPPHDPARTFLTASLGLSAADVDRIDAGRVYARTLDVSDRREVATLGVVRIQVTPEFYVARLADIVSFKRDESVLQIGAFGNPPRIEDVANLTLDESDIRSLRDCRVGRCGVQLSAEAIRRFERGVEWRRSDATDQANALMREILVEYVARYREGGTAASMQYADGSAPLDLAREFAALVESSDGDWHSFPDLRERLFAYPAGQTEGSSDVLYWSKERTGRKSIVSVTHLAIVRIRGDSPADYAVASKHLYGTHYIDASVGLTVLLRDRSASPPSTYLAYLNRSRVDIFGGVFGPLARKLVTSKARSTVSSQLARLQRTLERQFTGGS